MQNVNWTVSHKSLSLLLVVGTSSCRTCFYNRNRNKTPKKFFFSFQNFYVVLTNFSFTIIFISIAIILAVAVICRLGFSTVVSHNCCLERRRSVKKAVSIGHAMDTIAVQNLLSITILLSICKRHFPILCSFSKKFLISLAF